MKSIILGNTRLNQAYDLVNTAISGTNWYIANGTDFKGDSILITITGNLNENIPNLSGMAQLTKTSTKKNKVLLTFKILKKNLEKPILQKIALLANGQNGGRI